MHIEDALYSALSGSTDLVALVGARITPAKTLQASDFPCVTFRQIHGAVSYTQDGPVSDEQDIWQFDAWVKQIEGETAAAYDQMRAIKRAIREALHGATEFTAYLDQNQDLYEDKTRVHHGLIDARIWWKNA